MFLRQLVQKKKGQTYTYLKLVENQWQEGKSVQKTLLNFGNINFWPPERLRQVQIKIATYLGEFEEKIDPNIISALDFGPYLALNSLWKHLGMSQLINNELKDRKLEFDLPRATKVMTYNRLVDPMSKLAVSRWQEDQIISNDDGSPGRALKLQDYYKSLDELVEIKEPLEESIYNQVSTLFNLDVSLVFYDITSSYFEGLKCRIARKGYSREHRPDRKQILIGLLVNGDGIPIGHHVFEGNIKDITTTIGTINDTKKRFRIKTCIFVGDSGILDDSVFDEVSLLGYRYIASLKLEHSPEAKELLKELPKPSELTKIKDNLFISELDPQNGVRYIVTYNPLRAADSAKKFRKSLCEAVKYLKSFNKPRRQGQARDPKKVNVQIGKWLSRKGLSQYFNFEYKKECDFNFSPKVERIRQHRRTFGIRILRTTVTDQTAEEIALNYRKLSEVESSFKEIKNFLGLRPTYVWTENHVKGHVFICVLAYLFEKLFEQRLEYAKVNTSVREAIRRLKTIRVVKIDIQGRILNKVTRIKKEQREILKAVGVKSPPTAI